MKSTINEIQGINKILSIFHDKNPGPDGIFQKIVETLPQCLQNTDLAGARLVLHGRGYATNKYSETRFKISSDIVISGKISGKIDVWYPREYPVQDEDIFLLEAVAGSISLYARLNMAEQKLKESNDFLNKSQSLAHLGTWELHVPGNQLKWSDEVFRMFGYEPQEIPVNYEIFLELVHPDDRGPVNAAYLSSVAESRDSYEIVHRIIKNRTGEVRYVHEKCEHTKDCDGTIIRSIGMVQDITERVEKEKKIIDYSEQLRKLQVAVEQSPVTIAITNADGILEYVNPAFSRITGYSSGEAIGMNPRVLKSDKTPPDTFNDLWKTITSGNTWTGEFINKKKNGELYFEEAIISPVKDSGNKITNFIAVKTDITLRKQQEEQIRKTTEQLKELNATKDKFFSIIAHDLKNPFQTILGFSDMLLQNFGKYDPEKIHRYVTNIHNASHNTFKLLENLLDWSRSQRGAIPFSPKQIPVSPVFEEISRLFDGKTLAKKIKLTCHCGKEIEAKADLDMLKTILRNLVSNAIKFTKPEGSVSVRAVKKEPYLEISVTDTGIGMSEATKDNLFQIATSISTPGTGNEEGTGLGLLLCKEFIDRHGGEIHVSSMPGNGSCFTFTLPN